MLPLVAPGVSRPWLEWLDLSRFGLDQPVPVQYWRYMSALLRGDFGESATTGRPVLEDVRLALARTDEHLELVVAWWQRISLERRRADDLAYAPHSASARFTLKRHLGYSPAGIRKH